MGKGFEACIPTVQQPSHSSLPTVGLGPLAGVREALTPALSSCPPCGGARWSELLLAGCLAISQIRGLGLIARKASISSPGSQTRQISQQQSCRWREKWRERERITKRKRGAEGEVSHRTFAL